MKLEAVALRGLPKRLVSAGILDAEQALAILRTCAETRETFIAHVVNHDLLPASLVAQVASEEFGIPLYDLDAHDLTTCPQKVVSAELVEKHLALPLYKRGNRLFVAVSDPTNQYALTDIRFQTGSQVEPVIVEHDKLALAVERYLSANDATLAEALEGIDEEALEAVDLEAARDKGEEEGGESDAPIVRFVNKILLDGIRKGASDIHFEPYEKRYRIRYRIDGMLVDAAHPPVAVAPRLAARLKVMSQMDLSERRRPQDGRIKVRVSKSRSVDFRVNSLPTLFGEKIVLRILDASQARLGIDALGYEPDQKEAYLEALSQSQGMILMTGPTGSGKTVSLYTGLGILNTPERNICTAEDPVEINMEGINQVQVNPKIGFTFAEALRAFLRQDPDVIMVGEIRDLETAEIAIKAAQTGHLVLSTLHTNSAPETLTRLLNMGVASFNVATSVSLIIAQRLARKLCEHCREPWTDLPERVLEEEGLAALPIPREEITVYRPVGCKHCTHGYKGRTGVYEVLKISPAISRLIMEGGNSIQIAEQARREGFRTLRESALLKVARGIIGLEEANRITKD
ncbi:MAG: type 4 fimbrial assembly protein PilB [Porticoccaceae bacterium]|nr:MAG: type 4 fimbrial assembly protein PilB [Porticoccaceae bacterium]